MPSAPVPVFRPQITFSAMYILQGSVTFMKALFSSALLYNSYVITIGILVLVDSGSFEDSSLTHGKRGRGRERQRGKEGRKEGGKEKRHILKPDVLTWFQSKIKPGCSVFCVSSKFKR